MRFGVKYPPYQFEPYPAWVKGRDGKDVLVHSAEEQAKVLGQSIHVDEVETEYDSEFNDASKLIEGVSVLEVLSDYDCDQPRRRGWPKGKPRKPKGE